MRRLVPFADFTSQDRTLGSLMRFQPVDRFQSSLRPCAHSYIIGQVYPTDRASRVHQELSGTRDVLAVLATLRMQDSVLPDHLRARIGEEREAVPFGLAEPLRLRGRIHADRYNLNTPVMKLAQVLLETPQLGVAERSPISAIENQHDRARSL